MVSSVYSLGSQCWGQIGNSAKWMSSLLQLRENYFIQKFPVEDLLLKNVLMAHSDKHK